jgi:hypothetical protein
MFETRTNQSPRDLPADAGDHELQDDRAIHTDERRDVRGVIGV